MLKFNNTCFIAIIFLTSSLMGCSSEESSSNQKKSKPEFLVLSKKAVEIGQFKSQPVGQGIIRESVQLQGSIRANKNNVTSVVTKVSGLVLKIHKELGEKVKKDDALMELNSKEMGEAQLEYINLYQKKSFAWNRLKMEKKLYKKKISSRLAYLQEKEKFDKASIALSMASQKLKLLGATSKDIKNLPARDKDKLTVYILRAPVAGKIIEKNIARGEMVKSDRPVFVLANLNSVWLDIKVPVQYLDNIKPGAQVNVFSGKLKKNIAGKVEYVSPTADEKTRSALVRVLLPNKKGIWRPGLCAMAEFVVNKKEVELLVPKTAIFQMTNKTSVFVETKERHYKLKTVIVGETDKDSVEITHGLKPGEKVVVNNIVALKGEWLAVMGN
ncbi:MAG: efflux RND transporter periplasmic adaptor subunit [Myxococcota bacterium]